MTVVSLRGLHTALGEPVVTSGVVMVEYWAGSRPVARVDGADVIFPALITAPVVAGDPGILDLPPTRGVCCVKWTVQSESSATPVVRFTEIPETPTDFGDLVQVDPATFVPTGEVVAAWEAVVGTVEGLRADAASFAGEAAASAQAAHDAAAPVAAAAATISAGIDATDGALAAVLDDPESESTNRLTAKIGEETAAPLGAKADKATTYTKTETVAEIDARVPDAVASAVGSNPAVVSAEIAAKPKGSLQRSGSCSTTLPGRAPCSGICTTPPRRASSASDQGSMSGTGLLTRPDH